MQTNRRFFSFALSLLAPLAAACSPPANQSDAGDAAPVVDAPVTETGVDAPVTTDGGTDASADAPVDGGTTPRCGTDRPDISGISGTEGLVIAADGTIYYSQAGGVGRMRPGMAQEDDWVSVGPAGGTIWGFALDAAHHKLYVGSPQARAIFSIDLSAATAAATMVVASAGQPNGLTFGPDGAVYYSDFGGGAVYRVDTSTNMRTRVTTSTIAGADGVAFAADGSLYVDSYMTGSLIKLTLAGGMETARMTVAMGLGNPDGLAFDSTGGIYVSNNSGGQLYHLNADGTMRTTLRMGIGSAANIEFGAGALSCTDIYVASGGALVRYEMGTVTGAMVPWH